MEITSTYDEARRLATHAVTGAIDLERLFTFVETRPAPFDWTWAVLWDIRGLADPRPSTEDLHAYRERLRNLWPAGARTRTALVAARDLDFGVGKMVEAYTAPLPRRVRVFRDLEAARAWLLEPEGPA